MSKEIRLYRAAFDLDKVLTENLHRVNVQDVVKAIKRYPLLSKVFGNRPSDSVLRERQSNKKGASRSPSMHPSPFLSLRSFLIVERLRRTLNHHQFTVILQ